MSPRSVDSEPVGFGVIGANSFVANAAVLPAIESTGSARLVAAASRSAPVPSRWAHAQVGTYDDVLTHPGVEAVYLPLPNGLHRTWTERAAEAGKHVLCEKPLAPDVPTARAMAAACEAAGVILAEAWMTPFDRRWSTALRLAHVGEVGRIESQTHRFTFTIAPEQGDNYRWDRAQGGGALLDVGIYCVGTAVELWGADCDVEWVRRTTTGRGVDARTEARLRWPDGRHADIVCSFVDEERQSATFESGCGGELRLDHAAFTSGHDHDHLIVRLDGDGRRTNLSVTPGNPYRSMVEAFAGAVRRRAEWPRPIERSIEMLTLIERIASVDSTPTRTDDD